MRICFGLCLLIHLSSCAKEPIHIIEAHNVRDLIQQEASKKYNLQMWGSGGTMMFDVERISLRFCEDKNLSISESRRIFAGLMEKGLLIVNNYEPIKPYLHNYPFTENDLDIVLTFFDPQGPSGYPFPPFIARVGINKNIIRYSVRDTTNRLFKDVHTESYQEALEIVRRESAMAQ